MLHYSRIFLFLLTFLLASAGANGQAVSWAKSVYNTPSTGDRFAKTNASAMDNSGNLYVASSIRNDVQIGTQVYTTTDTTVFATIIKYDQNGSELWVYRFFSTLSGWADIADISDMKVDGSGNLFVTGSFTNVLSDNNGVLATAAPGQTDYFVMKMNPAGNVIWMSTGGGSGFRRPMNLTLDNSGNIFIGGYYTFVSGFGSITLTPAFPTSQYGYSAFLARLDQAGVVTGAWSSVNATTNTSVYVRSVGADQSGNIYLAGIIGNGSMNWGAHTVSSFGTNSGSFWLKLNSSAQAIHSFVNETSYSHTWGWLNGTMRTDATGFSYLTDVFRGTINLGGISFSTIHPNNTDAYLAKYDPNGVLQWATHLKSTSTSGIVEGTWLSLDNLGRLYITGVMAGNAIIGNQPFTNPSLSNFAAAFDQMTGNPVWALKNTIAPGPMVSSAAGKFSSIASSAGGQIGWTGNFFGGPVDFGTVITGAQAPLDAFSFYVARILQQHNTITGNVFIDSNLNGIRDTTETAHPNSSSVAVLPGPFAYQTNSSGDYNAIAEIGNYTVSLPNPPMYYTVVPTGSASATFSTFGNVESGHDFALQPIANQQDLRINVTSLWPPRPGFTTSYRITYKNPGTVAIPAGTVTLSFDPMFTYLSSSVPATQSGSTLTFNYSNLLPNQTHNIDVVFSLTALAPLGQSISVTASIDPITGDLTPADNTETSTRTIVGSWDPNSIEVDFEQLTTQQVQTAQKLNYTIRFQNLGTDTAFTVMLRDSIPAFLLNLGTIELVSSSHSCTWTLNQAGILTVLFTSIKLPHQGINSIGSNGFVRFQIRPFSTLAVGDIIPNKADIYFDYNAPITTNTASTEVVLQSGTAANVPHLMWQAYPNPAHDALTVQAQLAQAGPVTVTLVNMLGQEVYAITAQAAAGNYRQQVQTAHLPAGIYTLRLLTSGGSAVKQIVKQ